MTTNVHKHHTTCIFQTKFVNKMLRKIQHLLRNNTTNTLLCDVYGHYFFQSIKKYKRRFIFPTFENLFSFQPERHWPEKYIGLNSRPERQTPEATGGGFPSGLWPERQNFKDLNGIGLNVMDSLIVSWYYGTTVLLDGINRRFVKAIIVLSILRPPDHLFIFHQIHIVQVSVPTVTAV